MIDDVLYALLINLRYDFDDKYLIVSCYVIMELNHLKMTLNLNTGWIPLKNNE